MLCAILWAFPTVITGNEVECEQVVWAFSADTASTIPPPSAAPVPFSTFLWRRGTVPIWWGAEIKSSIQDAEIFVHPNQPLAHSARYFSRLARRLRAPRQHPAGMAKETNDTAGSHSGTSLSGNQTGTSTNSTNSTSTNSRAGTTRTCSSSRSSGSDASVPGTVGSVGAGAGAGRPVKIVCVDLLRTAQGKSEVPLTEKFRDTLSQVGPTASATAGTRAVAVSAPVPVPVPEHVSLDWHATTRTEGEAGAVEVLWRSLRNSLPALGLSLGVFLPGASRKASPGAPGGMPGAFPGADFSTQYQEWERRVVATLHGSTLLEAEGEGKDRKGGGKGWYEWETPAQGGQGAKGGLFRVLQQQEGLLRFNCADSLDRTNAASFFAAVQALCEQCRLLDIPLDQASITAGTTNPSSSSAPGAATSGGGGTTGGALSSGNAANSDPEEVEKMWRRALLDALPAGWEMRRDVGSGRFFYIDHNSRKTTWTHPCPPPRPSPRDAQGAAMGGAAPSNAAAGVAAGAGALAGAGAGAGGGASVGGTRGGGEMAKAVERMPWERMGLSVWEFRESVLPSALAAMSDLFAAGGERETEGECLTCTGYSFHDRIITCTRISSMSFTRSPLSGHLCRHSRRRHLPLSNG